jgi:hypothetical protein
VAANIIYFHKITKRFKSVTYDNERKDAFVVERDNRSKMEYVPSKEGLCYYDFNLSTMKVGTRETKK